MALRFAPARGSGALVLNSLFRGPTGAAATLSVGTVTTLAAGSSATGANSGSTAAAVLDLGIPRGADAGIKWLFETSTVMEAPATGGIRFNHATLSSVTAIAVSATGSGADQSDYVVTWDDSGSGVKGYIVAREEAGSVAAVLSISAVADNTTWLQLTVAYVSGSLSLAAADPLYLNHSRTGDPGAIGGSTGGTDNRVLRSDGAGGATIQNSGVTIDDSDHVTGMASLTLTNTGLHILDTNASHDLVIVPGSDLTADRNLTLTTGDAARTVTISGNATISQDYSTTGDVQFATATLDNTGLHLLDTNASHDLIIAPGSDLTADRTLTLTTGDAARTLTISGDHTLPTGTSVVLAGNQTLTGGFLGTPGSVGTKSTGTYTPNPLTETSCPYAVNGGAHTLAPPATAFASMCIEYTNNASAGAVTTSGFTYVTGDTITTTNGHKFFFWVTKHQTYSHLHVQKLQ